MTTPRNGGKTSDTYYFFWWPINQPKSIIWTDVGTSFKGIGKCMPKTILHRLYLSDIVLCTDASDHAIGAYLYQKEKTSPDTIKQPIRFLSKIFNLVQSRWSVIGKDHYANVRRSLGRSTIHTPNR